MNFTEIKEWFNNLQPRERNILIGGVIFVVIMILYLVIWEPLVNGARSLEKSIQLNQETVDWMQQSVSEVRELQAKINSTRPMNRSAGQSLLGIIDRTAKQAKLGKNVKRVQPDGKDKAKVWLEDVSFNDMIRWLEDLQRREGIRIDVTVIERKDTAGLVDARLELLGAS